MLLSDLQSKDIISLSDGRKIGIIIDITIDDKGMIVDISVQKKRFLIFHTGVVKISWKQIDKIGKDVILIDGML